MAKTASDKQIAFLSELYDQAVVLRERTLAGDPEAVAAHQAKFTPEVKQRTINAYRLLTVTEASAKIDSALASVKELKAQAPAAKSGAMGMAQRTLDPVPEAIHIGVDGEYYKVYRTQNDRLATKVLVWVGGTARFEYCPGGIAKGQLRESTRLSQEQARAFGMQHSICCNCLAKLDDDRSIAAGYGPTCAKHNGWYYPNKAEAAAILRPELCDEVVA